MSAYHLQGEKMPHSSSAKKRLKQNEKCRLRNKSVRSAVRTAMKNFRGLVASGDLDEARRTYRGVQKQLDQAVSKGVYHKNTAGRYKSHLAALLNPSSEGTG